MPDPFDFYLSSPTIDADTVYIGSGDGNIYALDAASGALRWKFRTGNVVHASPAIANGTVYIGSWDSYFYAIDAKSGQQRWRFKTGEDHEIANQVGIQSSAVIADGVVYFGCRDSNLYALDAASGAKEWAYSNKGSWVISTPIAMDGTAVFRHLGFCTFQCSRCQNRCAQVFAELPSLALVFLAGDRRPESLYRLARRHLDRDRSR